MKRLLFVLFLSLAGLAAHAQSTFTVGDGTFLLDGKPFAILAAEVHYPRIPQPYWEQRIKMCKALGMNALCIYIFWNVHEQREGEFDFTGGNDIRAFVLLAQKHGLYVIVRPGPYVCAEWEMGGLPWWLLRKRDVRLREQDPYFMERLECFERKVGEQLADLTIDKGGPIIMVQVENEYGSYGEDKAYVAAVRDVIRRSGFDRVQLFQCDWSSNFTKNGLDDLLWTMNFGTGANIDDEFRRLGELRPRSPRMCSEFWSGWFDEWGRPHETRDSRLMVEGLREMMDKGISFSLYMTHGGTNWSHWAGANTPGYVPHVTSYDYDAPISEAGHYTPKYWALRDMMARYAGRRLPAPPKEIPVIAIPKVRFAEVAPLFDNLPAPKRSADIRPMEDFGQGYGCILYRTVAPRTDAGSVMTLKDAHDYAQVFVDGRLVGAADRIRRDSTVLMPALKGGERIDILVEATGRINFGRGIDDRKGITDRVTIDYTRPNGSQVSVNLKDWTIYNLYDDYATQAAMHYVPLDTQTTPGCQKTSDCRQAADGRQTADCRQTPDSQKTSDCRQTADSQRLPGCYRATFSLSRVGDTYFNLGSWGKGQVYVNGHPIGRFWRIGPQQTLYMPGCWLRKGENEIIVWDIVGPQEPQTEGLTTPIIDRLQ